MIGVVLLGTSLVLFGCARVGGEDLVIASSWPESERAALEAGFRRRVATSPGAGHGPVRIGWVLLSPGDDLARVARRRGSVDLVLGGPASSYRRLERAGRLIPAGREGQPAWLVSRRSPIGLAMGPRAARAGTPAAGSAPAPRPDALTFDDPRQDPVSLAWAKGQLGAGTWAEGYARLVRGAGSPRRIGRQAGAALAAVERGEAALAPALPPRGADRRARLGFLPDDDAPEWVEGVALVRGGRHPGRAREFLGFLAGRGQAQPPPAGAPGAPEADALLAELLGATLVDAQDELWAARATLAASGHPGRAERWMTEPPPWPPASVATILQRRDDPLALLNTLAEEIAPEADVRGWLVRSWLRTARPIDGALLEELATAADGRLAREPRVRAWLRAEWTAWARQRYRRVARLAGAAPTAATPGATSPSPGTSS
ncbi:MAG TPA: hypothetical protein VKP69_30615 [Isosphaeraceae bacterium]|nr:hypothetical protein [Isosphaeraceae bacterium]